MEQTVKKKLPVALKKWIALLMAVWMLVSTLLSMCACGDKVKSTVEPGHYQFDLKNYKTFLEVETPKCGKRELKTAAASSSLTVTTKPKPYAKNGSKAVKSFYFDNCYLVVEYTANDVTERKQIDLPTNGKCSEDIEVLFSPAYQIKDSFKVVEASGTVIAGAFNGSTFVYNNVEYTCSEYMGNISCHITKYKSKPKTLYLQDYVDNGNGEMIPFDGTFRVGCDSVETIILDGTFSMSSIDWREKFPNLKTVAIRSVTPIEKSPFVAWNQINIALPEGGVTFYLDDEAGDFTNALKNAYFVTDIRPFSEFNMSNYSTENK